MPTLLKDIPQTLTPQAQEPAWLTGLRQRAMSRYLELGLPTRRNEAWKAINLREILDTPFEQTSEHATVSADKIQHHFLEGATRLVFVNGRYDAALSNNTGEYVRPLGEALEQWPLEQYFGRGISDDADAFAVLNTGLFADGAVVYLPENTTLDKPVQLLFLTTSTSQTSQAVYPRTLIIGEENTDANVLIQYLGLGANVLNVPVQEIFAAKNAELNVTLTQLENSASYQLAATRTYSEAGAQIQLNTTSFTGKTLRHAVESYLGAETAQCELNGLNVLKGKTEAYHHTVIHHQKPHGVSRQYYKGVLDDQTKSEFDGTIIVYTDAQKTDSEQLNKNLLLSDDAKVFTRPQLQISADDVKCAHGATVGQLAENELFYLASRGIDKKESQALLTYGFAEEMVEKITEPTIQAYLTCLVIQNLNKKAAK